ncbi:MAG: DNA polymerase III subunit alpha, partial [Prevotella sp.]|nr:DNA polymerase III subunit alpha [Prevotella sp.]
CNTTCQELADVQQLKGRATVVLGGIVTGVRQKFTKRGEPCGFVTIEDYEGGGELALFGQDWGRWNGMFTEGASVFITAKLQPRFRDSEQMELKVQNVEYLQTVKDKAVDRITISVISDMLNEDMLAELNTQLTEHPGKTKLFFQLRDTSGDKHVLLRSQSMFVDVKYTLIDYIERTDGLDYKIN